MLLTLTYGQRSGPVQRGVSTVFAPLQWVADRALKPARDAISWFDETFEARGENERLRAQLERARALGAAGQLARQENAQLRALVKLNRSPTLVYSSFEPVTGRVISRSPTFWNAAVTIDLGSSDGVRVNDPVVSGDGLVGGVASVFGGSAKVVLLTDHTSAVTAKVLPGGVQGVVQPEVGDPEDLVLDFIDETKGIGVGQTVVTSGWRVQGYASSFPQGLLVGEVTRAPIREQEASQRVHLRPFADFANLDFVTVLTGGGR